MRTSSRHSTTAGPVCCRSSTTSFLLLHCSTSNLRRTRGLITSVCVWLCYDDRVVRFINSCALLLLPLPFLLPLQQPLQQRARRGIVRHIYGERRFSASPWLQRSIHPESLRRSSSNPKSQPIPSSDQHRVPDHKTSLTGQSVVSFSSSSRFLLHKSASCNTVANTLQTPFNDGSSSRKKNPFQFATCRAATTTTDSTPTRAPTAEHTNQLFSPSLTLRPGAAASVRVSSAHSHALVLVWPPPPPRCRPPRIGHPPAAPPGKKNEE